MRVVEATANRPRNSNDSRLEPLGYMLPLRFHGNGRAVPRERRESVFPFVVNGLIVRICKRAPGRGVQKHGFRTNTNIGSDSADITRVIRERHGPCKGTIRQLVGCHEGIRPLRLILEL